MAQLKVVTSTNDPVYSRKLFGAGDAMMQLRMRMYEWDPKDLAEEVGVSLACIYAIRSGKTKWPRPKTMFKLVEALDFELRLIDRRFANDKKG